MSVQQIPESSEVVLGRVFADLANQWRAETMYLSDNEKAAAHPIYRALIALGSRVVPFMLRNVQSENPDH